MLNANRGQFFSEREIRKVAGRVIGPGGIVGESERCPQ